MTNSFSDVGLVFSFPHYFLYLLDTCVNIIHQIPWNSQGVIWLDFVYVRQIRKQNTWAHFDYFGLFLFFLKFRLFLLIVANVERISVESFCLIKRFSQSFHFSYALPNKGLSAIIANIRIRIELRLLFFIFLHFTVFFLKNWFYQRLNYVVLMLFSHQLLLILVKLIGICICIWRDNFFDYVCKRDFLFVLQRLNCICLLLIFNIVCDFIDNWIYDVGSCAKLF